MSEAIATYQKEDTPMMNPVTPTPRFDNINQGSVAIESSRAVAEAQGKLVIAKRFPRDPVMAHYKIIEACQREGFASKAFYSFPRGKETVSGPTIRFAEELARCWGNLDYGIKELSQEKGRSELQAYCWDLETNTISVQNFTNLHARELKGGKIEQLTGLRDIYEVNANMAARRLRARILAILPSDLVEEAVAECKKTLKGKNDVPLIDRVKKMVVAFGKLGVTKEMIEKRLDKKVDEMNVDDLVDYTGIYNALKDGASKVSDWFTTSKTASELTGELESMGDFEEV